jgi:collagenase-like PrtC family protease
VAHDKHVLSLKDNDQSANLRALVDAGIRSFKIEGRYKDMATVKNVTAHYRQLLDALLDRAPTWPPPAAAAAAPLHARPRARLQPRRHRLLRQRPAGRHRRLRQPQTRRHAGGRGARVGPDHFDVQRHARNRC